MNASSIHLAVAGLFGLAGVVLLALGAHSGGAGQATVAGQMLLFHAPALIAGTAARKAGLLHDLIARLALSALALGAALFAADLARRGFGGDRLFPGAAPAGGFLSMAGWLGLTLSALLPRRG